MKVISEALETHFGLTKEIYLLTPDHTLHHLIQTHRKIYQYYRTLGIDKIRELEYKPRLIEQAYEQYQLMNGDPYFQMLNSLKAIFKRINRASTDKVRKILKYYFYKYNITGLRATVAQLSQWFEIYRTTDGYNSDGTEIKIHVIGRPRF